MTGVKYNKRTMKYEVYIHHNGMREFLGSRDTEREAGLLYDQYAIKLNKPTNILKKKHDTI